MQTCALVSPCPDLADTRAGARLHTQAFMHTQTYTYTCACTHPAPLPAPRLAPQRRCPPDGQLSLRSLRSQEEMPGRSATLPGAGRGCAGGGEPPRGPGAASSLLLCPRSRGALQVLGCLTATCHAARLPLRTLPVPRPLAASPWWARALDQGLRGG